MKIGVMVAQDFWMHFRAIYDELEAHHKLVIYKEGKWPLQLMSDRMNRFIRRRDLTDFMRNNDLVFFEWGEHEFVEATLLPKTCKIVTRIQLHEVWDFVPLANLDHIDHVILVSHAMERKLLAKFPAMSGRTSVIYNGVSLTKFHPEPHPYHGVIGMLNRIENYKREYEMIVTLYQLRRMGYDFTLNIAGSCTEKKYERYEYEVHLLVERLGMQPYVTFSGFVTDTPKWLHNIDIFCSNSISEGLQVALLEAMASGVHCIAHHWDGVEDALPQENIYISEADCIEKLIAYQNLSDNEKHQAGARMRQIACENFDIEKIKEDVRNLVEKV